MVACTLRGVPALAGHLSGALRGVREGLDGYREHVMLENSHPRFAEALGKALAIDGYTTASELSLLYHLALAADGRGVVVEIGSYLGRSTVVLASACADGGREPVAAVDPHTAALGIEGKPPRDTREEFLVNVHGAGVAGHVRLLQATSVEAAREWPGDPVRLLFVDGWHSREAVLEDVGSWAPFFSPHVCVAFDDYMVSDGVRAAVRELQAGGAVRRKGVIVGKMAAFGPTEVLERVPVPPPGRLLGRLGDRAQEAAIKLAAR